MRYFVVPARKGSKRLPGKNRKLLKYTLNFIPKEKRNRLIVTSDDPHILQKTEENYSEAKKIKRPKRLAEDETPIRPVLKNVANELNLNGEDELVLLYLTYPEREFSEVKKAIKFFENRKENSMLCKQPVKSHPYLCMYKEGDKKGSQIIEHDLHRYQDYPEVFEVSHYIAITKVSELPNLKKNIFNENTVYFPIDNVVDVDEQEDLEKFLKERE